MDVIGCTARIQASRNYETLPAFNNLFSAFDVPLNEEARRHEAFQQLYAIGSKSLPSTWNFVAISLCPSGEVLISSIRNSSLSAENIRAFVRNVVCIFPPSEDEDGVVNNLFIKFNNLMERNNVQLSRPNEEAESMSESAKKKWWMERRSLGEELKSLLIDMDEQLFNHTCMKELISCDRSYADDDLNHVSGNLSLQFEAMCSCNESEASKRSWFNPEDSICKSSSDPQLSSSLRTDHVVFLVLDEHFQSLPMENVPTFIKSSVCRIPSIPFAITRCHNPSDENFCFPSVDLNNTTYVLDPESNLAECRTRMNEHVKHLSLKYGWNWSGIIGEMPVDDVIKAALKRYHSLYLFCGHGGGESILRCMNFKHKYLDSGKDKGSPFSPCRSALVLMGCSSGRLVSVNAAEDEFASYREYQYEPAGAIISYLCAGAPCIVGNLWDVPDRDTDR